jgi:Protein of unknown function (DUF3306)
MADEGFLQRWSRRKAEARSPLQEREAAQDPITERADAPESADPPAFATAREARARDDDALVDLDLLPDIDTLTFESDFTVFMRKGVPAELRKRALQRLWRSHPTLANLDGLLEYGEDYSKIGTAKQVVRTAYQVGRGMLGRLDPQAASAAPAPPGQAASAPAEPLPTASLPAPEEPGADQVAGQAPGEVRAMPAARQEGPKRLPGENEDGHRSRLVARPRPLPRRG